jgi:DNA-binding response OmpR family regulator
VVWGSSPDIDTRTVDVHVSHLRSKLKLVPENGWRLTSVYRQGYRLERVE